MDTIPSPRELRTAARACVALAYLVGFVGAGAGAFLLHDGAIASAVVVWASTFALGAALTGISLVLRAMVGVLARIAQLWEAQHPDPEASEAWTAWPGA